MKKVTIKRLLDISIAMAEERNGDALLERILTDAMDITECDGGTLYIKTDDALEFKVMVTKSLNIRKGGKNGKIDLPPVPLSNSNVCAYSVLENKLINIPDVYESELFDFSGPRNYDAMTGYKTTSMMVVPMENNKGQIIGVMQLINAKNSKGKVIPFIEDCEIILLALASQSAVSLTNMNYTVEMRELMDSIVETFSTAIYVRTPYNVNHTRNMVKYASNFVDWLNKQTNPVKTFNFDEKRQFLMAIWLHDLGKLVTPMEIMNKETRLGDHAEIVMTRLDMIYLLGKIQAYENNTCCDEYLKKIEEVKEFVKAVEATGFLSDEMLEKVKVLANLKYIDQHGNEVPWFTEEEIVCMSIRKGTLTDSERTEMQKHVSMTRELLEKMKFRGEYKKIPKWASEHHELLNGTGYPDGLKDDELEFETRLLTIIDIFDGLSSTDRPYKPAMPLDRVFSILSEMVACGQLDSNIFELFKQSKAWE